MDDDGHIAGAGTGGLVLGRGRRHAHGLHVLHGLPAITGITWRGYGNRRTSCGGTRHGAVRTDMARLSTSEERTRRAVESSWPRLTYRQHPIDQLAGLGCVEWWAELGGRVKGSLSWSVEVAVVAQ
jgi:hypothetical protein